MPSSATPLGVERDALSVGVLRLSDEGEKARTCRQTLIDLMDVTSQSDLGLALARALDEFDSAMAEVEPGAGHG